MYYDMNIGFRGETMKILVVSNMYPDKKNPSYGIFVSRFCDQLDQLGISFDKVVMNKGNSKPRKLINYFKFYLSTFLKCLLKNYDIIYVHYASHSSAPVIAANRIRKKKIVVNVHGSDVVPENARQEKMQKYTRVILKLCSVIVVPSDYFRQYVSNKYNINKERIYIYPSAGVNESIFYQNDKEKLAERLKRFKLTPNKIRVGFVGRISSGKGWDTFVLAAERIIKLYNNFEFIMVGNGPEEEKLDKLIKDKQLEQHIQRFPLLSQEELAQIYNCFNIFVFPTEREGESLGLVAIEAMACGTPVIASNFAAPMYYIKDGVNGFKFEKGNVTMLSDIIIRYSKLSQKEIEALEKAAIETAKEYYESNIITKLQKLFKVI